MYWQNDESNEIPGVFLASNGPLACECGTLDNF